MKKTILLIMSIVGVLLFSSAFRGGIAPVAGSIAPKVEIYNQDSRISLNDYRGKYVMLSFWSAADARSRMKTIELYGIVNQANETVNHGEEPNVEFMAVNFDRSERLFREIATRDNLDLSSQHFVRGTQAEAIKRDYGLEKGYRAFLIGPSGHILAVNPDKNTLKKYLSL